MPDFSEADHPRDSKGQFTSGGEGGSKSPLGKWAETSENADLGMMAAAKAIADAKSKPAPGTFEQDGVVYGDAKGALQRIKDKQDAAVAKEEKAQALESEFKDLPEDINALRQNDDISMDAKDDAEFWKNAKERTKDTTSEEQTAVMAFTGGNYLGIREAERKPEFEEVREKKRTGTYDEQQARLLEEFLDNSKPTPGTVYRGLAVEPDRLDALLHKDTITMPAVSSTSRSIDTATSFAQNSPYILEHHAHPVVLRMKQKTGVAVEHISSHEREQEIIMPKGTTFKITKRSRAGSFLIIDAEEQAPKPRD